MREENATKMFGLQFVNSHWGFDSQTKILSCAELHLPPPTTDLSAGDTRIWAEPVRQSNTIYCLVLLRLLLSAGHCPIVSSEV